MNKENENNTTTALSKISAPVSDVLNLDLTGDNLDKSIAVLTKIVASKKFKEIPTVEVAIGYYIKAKELGLPFLSSLDHMFNVGGKTNIDVHLMRALVLRAGAVKWKEVHNYAPLYKYIDNTGSTIVTGFDDTCLPYGFTIIKGKTQVEITTHMNEVLAIGETPIFKRVDKVEYASGLFHINYGTRYEFTRLLKNIKGEIDEIVEYGEFTFREAVIAGLMYKTGGTVLDDQSPWLVYMRNMLEHRSWTFGCRKIADDITFGLMERTEYLDTQHIPYTVEEGRATIINSNSADK